MFYLRYIVKCAGCGLEYLLHEQRGGRDDFDAKIRFSLPSGWTEGARDQYFCPRHVVVVAVMVDGKPA